MESIVFETLADPVRVQILQRLRMGEATVSDISLDLPIAQSGVSRHLRILTESGFVVMRKDAQRHIYQLQPERFRQIDDWLQHFRAVWEGRLDRLAAEAERQQWEKDNG